MPSFALKDRLLPEVLPCPFCAGVATLHGADGLGCGTGEGFRVVCPCGAAGPDGREAVACILDWNRLAALCVRQAEGQEQESTWDTPPDEYNWQVVECAAQLFILGGLPLKAVAKRLGLSYPAVRSWAKRHGWRQSREEYMALRSRLLLELSGYHRELLGQVRATGSNLLFARARQVEAIRQAYMRAILQRTETIS